MGKIHKIVGLKGLGRSGKTPTLRAFVDALFARGWCKVKVWAYTRYMKTTLDDIPSEGDYMVLLKRDDNHIVVVTGGDYPKRVSIILKVVLELNVEIDILYSAMRIEEETKEDVVSVFQNLAREKGIEFTVTMKEKGDQVDVQCQKCVELLYNEIGGAK